MSKGKYLALDYGDERTGVALSDEDKMIAFPRDFLLSRDLTDLFVKIKRICEEESVIKIIIGLPIEMDGTFGVRVEKTQEFGSALQNLLKIRIEYFDERLTTLQSAKSLTGYGISAKSQKRGIDSASAQLILQTYLKSLINS